MYAPQTQMPPGVDVKVSYLGRVVVSLVIGSFLLLAAIAALVATLLAGADATGGGAAPAASAGPPPCGKQLTDAAKCTGTVGKESPIYDWNVTSAGTYEIAVRQSTVERTVELMDAHYKSLAFDVGNPGPDPTITKALTPGSYLVRVGDLSTSPANAGKPFTLVITSKSKPVAAAPPPPAEPAIHPQAFVAVGAFFLLGLVFFAIPLVVLPEKKRIPLRIDAACVTMRDGRKHFWNAYQGITVQTTRTRAGTYENGVELRFATGFALVRYRPIKNLPQVMPIVNALKMGRNPWAY